MGYIEETGAAQFLRDARIAAIYEGTNGIQAIDLVQRKLGLSEGAMVRLEIADMRAAVAALGESGRNVFGEMEPCLARAVDALERATRFMLEASATRPKDALAGATPYLRLFALCARRHGAGQRARSPRTGSLLRETAIRHLSGRIATARFFAENIATGASGLEQDITRGAGSVHAGALALDS